MPGIETGNVLQLCDHAAKSQHFVVERGELFRLTNFVFHELVLEGAGDGGDRCAQLVADVGKHLYARVVGAGELAGHLVEREGKLADLVVVFDVDLLVHRPLADAAHGAGQLFKGLCEIARCEPADDDRDQKRHSDAEDNGLSGVAEIAVDEHPELAVKIIRWREITDELAGVARVERIAVLHDALAGFAADEL